MGKHTIKLLSRTDTEIPITKEAWKELEAIFMGGTLCDSIILDIRDWEEEWEELKEENKELFNTIQKLCKENGGRIEISMEL